LGSPDSISSRRPSSHSGNTSDSPSDDCGPSAGPKSVDDVNRAEHPVGDVRSTLVQLDPVVVEGLLERFAGVVDGAAAAELRRGAVDGLDVVCAALTGPLPADGRSGVDADRGRGERGVL